MVEFCVLCNFIFSCHCHVVFRWKRQEKKVFLAVVGLLRNYNRKLLECLEHE